MKEFKKNNNKFYHSPVFLFILLLLLFLLFYKVFGLIQKEKESSKNKDLLLEQIEDLKTRELKLSSEISSLDTEEGIERLIRDKYQVAKEGEKMVVIVGDEKSNISEIKNDRKKIRLWFDKIFGKLE